MAHRVVDVDVGPAPGAGAALVDRGPCIHTPDAATATVIATELARTAPDLSAAPTVTKDRWRGYATAVIPLAALLVAGPGVLLTASGVLFSIVFLAWIALRLVALATPPARICDPPVPDDSLPSITVVVALYREAAVVGRLIDALDHLDYPREKLRIILVLEEDDTDTLDAAVAHLGPVHDIVVVPPVGPRTKPKALDVALAYARCDIVSVFDAEDRPEPDQLRRVAAAFAAGGDDLACVQARLTIDNTGDGPLAAMFTAEYAGLFDVLLPGLAWWRLPLPLGGSSNHFRADVLRSVGAWDPFNLTEDADLGMRLARAGYRSTVIASSTYEEAPPTVRAWLRQRTRWFQGWMQTWMVHNRAPLRALRELGPAGFVTLQLVVGGTVLAALAHPLFGAVLAAKVVADGLPNPDALRILLVALFGVTTLGGLASSVLLGAVGLRRRGLLAHAWVLGLVPVYWVLLSIAAWRAAFKLARDPYRWDKTEHGFAKTSRLDDATPSPGLTRSSTWLAAPSARGPKASRSRS